MYMTWKGGDNKKRKVVLNWSENTFKMRILIPPQQWQQWPIFYLMGYLTLICM